MRSINIKQESVKQIIESLNVLLLAYKETLDFFSYQIKNISNRFVEVEDEITVKLSKLFALDKMVGENVLKMENLKLSAPEQNFDEDIQKCIELKNNLAANIDQISRMKRYVSEANNEFVNTVGLLNTGVARIGMLFETVYGKFKKLEDRVVDDIHIDIEGNYRLMTKLDEFSLRLKQIQASVENLSTETILADKKLKFYLEKYMEELVFCIDDANGLIEDIKKQNAQDAEMLDFLSKCI
jgi:archaellum component FlaC